MVKFLLIATPLYLIILYLFYRTTIDKVREDYGQREWKLWGTKTWYWQWAVIFCGGITYGIMAALKWANVVTF